MARAWLAAIKGSYVPLTTGRLSVPVRDALERFEATAKWSTFGVGETSAFIAAAAPRLWEAPSRDTLNVKNGLLDIDSGALRPHDPDFLSTVQLGVEFDPAAECPAWDRFIEEVFPEDAQSAPWEIIASCLTGDTSDRKAVLLLGEGKNGKSTFLRAATLLLGGRANVATISFQSLEGNKFSAAGLYGKLANVCPDLPSTRVENSSTFKAITGGDMLRAENKFQQQFEFLPYCRLVYSGNQLPTSADASQAFFDRWLVVPFAHRFPDNKAAGRKLDEALAAELPGALNKALAALRAMRGREVGERFTVAPSMRAAHAEFHDVTDPFTVWARECLTTATTTDGETVWTPSQQIFTALNKHLARERRPVFTDTKFGIRMREHFPHLEPAKRTKKIRGEESRPMCWPLMLVTSEADY